MSWLGKATSLVKTVRTSLLLASYKGLKAKANAHEGISSAAPGTIAGSVLEKSQEEVGTKLCDWQSMT